MRITSDLNLNGTSPARAQPKVGEWGPVGVPTTRFKKWQRVLIVLAFLAVAVALFFTGRFFYQALTGDGTSEAETVLLNHGAQVAQPAHLGV